MPKEHIKDRKSVIWIKKIDNKKKCDIRVNN